MHEAWSAYLLPVADDDGVGKKMIVSHDHMLAIVVRQTCCHSLYFKIWLHCCGLMLCLVSSTRSTSSKCPGAMAARRSSTDATASSLTCRWVCWCFSGGLLWLLSEVSYVVVHLKCPTHATRVIISCGRSLKMAQQHQHRMMTTAVITTKMSESFLSVTSEKCGPQGQDQMSIPVSLPLSKVTDPAMSGLR